MKKTFSQHMYDETERPGQLLPIDTHQIIRHRYQLAADLAVGKQVLEVGAGQGIGARLLNARAKHYIAGEYSTENIASLTQQGFCCVQCDAHQLPFKAHSFDLVVTLAMIYYLQLPQFLAQIYAVLKPGGCLYFCTSNQDVPGFVPSPFTTRYYSIPELNQLLCQQGFVTTFRGAFPATGGSYRRRQLRAGVKTAAKSMLQCLPWGKSLWQTLRAQQLGEHATLPCYVEDIADVETRTVALAPTQKNHDFRIIYGFAQKPLHPSEVGCL